MLLNILAASACSGSCVLGFIALLISCIIFKERGPTTPTLAPPIISYSFIAEPPPTPPPAAAAPPPPPPLD